MGSQAMALDSSSFWVGAGLGAGQLEESNSGFASKMRAFSGKLGAGYDLNSHFGLYLGYDFMQYIPEDNDIHLGSMGFVGRYPLSKKWDLVGNAGVVKSFGEQSRSGFAGTLGVGVDYQLTHAISTRMGVNYYSGLPLRYEREGDLYQAYWGLTYRFGQPETPMVIREEVPVEVIREVEVAQDVVRQEFVGEKLFAFNSSELKASSSLDMMMDALMANESLSLTLEGHSDSVGSEEYNQALSERRAQAVAEYFILNGIDASRITVMGKGSQEPVASNDSDIGRAQNRRVVLFAQ
ncbi:outer membrane protein A precursor [Vibrio metoecus]|nr:outer membrane protein A precursor [Vibrio metoecus]